MQQDTRLRINWYLNVLVVVLAASIPLYRKWVSVAVPLIFLLWILEGRWPEKLAVLRRHRLSLAVFGFVAFSLVSLLWSADPLEGIDYLKKYRYFLLIPVIATSLRRPLRRWAENAFIAGTSLSLVLSFAVFFGVVRLRDAYPGNPAPTMSHLDYSIVLAVAAAIILARILEGDLPPRRVALWTALLVYVLGGLAINLGRSGQAAFVGTALILIPMILGRRSPRSAVAGVLAATTILVLAFIAVPPLNDRVSTGAAELNAALTHGDYDSNQGMRVAGAIVAMDIVNERPVVGTGAGGNMVRFRELLNTRHPSLESEIGWFPHFHNQYLQTVTETGLVGLALLFLVFVALLAGPYDDSHDRNVATILVVTYLIGFLGDPYLHKQLPLVLFATFAGLVSARGHSLSWDHKADDRV
jgi:O-antigen ligase